MRAENPYMKIYRIAVGVFALVYAVVELWRGDWRGCIMFSAMGWLLLLDPTDPRNSKLRQRLALVALVCALLRYIL